tara:strand:+ start:566 stop:2473 length:1908 start_codon:yes stop_codon:yes gene_type:complete
MDCQRIEDAYQQVRGRLLAARTEGHYWEGELSSSPLSTATAVTALAIADRVLSPDQPRYMEMVKRGLAWIAAQANEDGGWGDTDRSVSNVSTTVLCWAALAWADPEDEALQATVKGAESWLTKESGGLGAAQIAQAVTARYGRDRTFSVPILTMAVLSGRLGPGRQAWKWVKSLPFELATFPASWYAALRLPVVSYALPALIAMGIARHTHLPCRSPIWRGVRASLKPKCMAILSAIQPSNGGFLEATPLTSFVAMSLASSRLAGHPVTLKAVEFIVNAVRPDGSWPIDTNLSTWLTSLSVGALGEGGLDGVDESEQVALKQWLHNQQYTRRHPYTQAAPGGWAWTPLPGGVPDADDTAGALVALSHFWDDQDRDRRVAKDGSNWLYRLQNQDGGIPTFCQGWGHLAFDRSSPDITAHSIRAWTRWIPNLMPNDQYRARRGLKRALSYLIRAQRGDGTWCPLWFGNQEAPQDENPTYGTARVVVALLELPGKLDPRVMRALEQAVHWLVLNQNNDGGWGGGFGTRSSTEETALATEALIACLKRDLNHEGLDGRWLESAASNGLDWLLRRIESDPDWSASPIGFYFAKLWYYETLYPLIFALGALRRAREQWPLDPPSNSDEEQGEPEPRSTVSS